MWCAGTMLLLFGIDMVGSIGKFLGIGRLRPLDFATTIVSIGLFATFYGILMGLYAFDPKAITQSVPHLLEGLRFAFAASVLGMFLSLTLSIAHKIAGEGEGTGSASNNDAVLRSIDEKMGRLVATLQSPQELVRQFADMKTFLKGNLEQINTSLDKALQQLAKGATQEVIQALEKIIVEFNRNLQEQFGENFKELNEACLKLVEWQRQYKAHVESAEKNLTKIMIALEGSSTSLDEMTKRNEEVVTVCREVGGLIRTYDGQIRTLSTHLESCKVLGEQAAKFLRNTENAILQSSENWTQFSQVVGGALSKQSDALVEFTTELDKQFPKALGDLEKVLTNITNQFASDYRSLFEYISDRR